MNRIARLADGWIMPGHRGEVAVMMEKVREYAEAAGRDLSGVAFVGGASGGMLVGKTPDDWVKAYEGWKGLGVTHYTVSTTGAEHTSVDQHIGLLRRFMEVMGKERG